MPAFSFSRRPRLACSFARFVRGERLRPVSGHGFQQPVVGYFGPLSNSLLTFLHFVVFYRELVLSFKSAEFLGAFFISGEPIGPVHSNSWFQAAL